MPDLVTLEQAKAHLRIEQRRTDLDADIALKISGASQRVLTHIKRDDLSEWQIEDTSPAEYDVPADIIDACLIYLTWSFDRDPAAKIPEAFYDLLVAYRIPTLG